MDMAEIRMPRSAMNDMKREMKGMNREMKCCIDSLTENNIELRLRFSLLDLALIVAGTTAVTAAVCAIKRSCRDKKIARMAECRTNQK